MQIRYYLWLLPFFSFLAGYYALYQFCNIESFPVPDLIGKKVHTALSSLSGKNLNLRVIAYKEDPDLPEGTIISQKPAHPQPVKPHQSVFLVISSHPVEPTMPPLGGLSEKEALALLAERAITCASYYVNSSAISGTCVAQKPLPHEPVKDGALVYFAAPTKKPLIMPNFKNKTVHDVVSFLSPHQISVEISHTLPQNTAHHCAQCTVTDQRPLAGTFIRLQEKKDIVHIKVAPA